MSASKFLFHLQDVGVDYGKTRALEGVSLGIGKGERVCLIGPSGGGKTTLLSLLNARVRATSGVVSVMDEDLAKLGVKDLRKLRSALSWVPQDLGLVGNLRVIQNVISGSGGQGNSLGYLRRVYFPKMKEAEEVHALLQRVGIGEKLYERAARLSGGQKQRVAIARALFQKPEAILADEPVSAVDPERARRLVDLLVRVSSEDERTLVMSLHDVGLAKEFFPRLIGLREGRWCLTGHRRR